MRVKLSLPLSITDISKAIGSIPTNLNSTVEYIVTDSKEAESGDLFFALDGKNHSGEEFVPEAMSRGAIPVTSSGRYPGLHVNNTRDALLSLAEFYLDNLPRLRARVCITGSVGKSTTKEFLSVISATQFLTHSTIKNYNNEIGVPLTVFSSPLNTEIIILELGTNHIGEIGKLSKRIHPTLSVITNVGTSHIGNFGSRRIIAKEKGDIILGMDQVSLLCEHNESLLDFIPDKKTVSCDSSLADFLLVPISESVDETVFDFFSEYGILSNVKFPIGGRHMLSSLAMAISAALTLGVSPDNIRVGAESITDECVRHRFIKIGNYIIFDDSYNAAAESVYADFAFLGFYKSLKRSALLGDILELGGETEKIHREIGEAAHRYGIDRLYLYGSYSPFIAEGARAAGMKTENIYINTDLAAPEITAEQITRNHTENEIILFKASHKINLRKIIDILKQTEGTGKC